MAKEEKKPTEYESDNVSKQWQSEGTPRPFDPEQAREQARNISGAGSDREHYSESTDEEEDASGESSEGAEEEEEDLEDEDLGDEDIGDEDIGDEDIGEDDELSDEDESKNEEEEGD